METSGAESFANTRSTLLSDLSTDCISTIVSMLPFVDLTSLLLSGSSTLSSRIIRQVRETDVLLGTGNKLPLNAYNFPHLHSLSIIAKIITVNSSWSRVVYEPYLVDYDILVKPHNTLSKLVLHGYLSFTILRPSDVHRPLDELLPNLLTLDLASPTRFYPRYINYIPSTLTELSLFPGSCDILPIAVVNKLPRTLTTLTLHNIPFKIGNESIELLSFPPALTSFVTGECLPLSLVEHLPRTLQTLEFNHGTTSDSISFKVSHFPPSLTSLAIPGLGWKDTPHYLKFDIPLSSYRLKTLKIPSKYPRLIEDGTYNLDALITTLNRALPPTLTSLNLQQNLLRSIDFAVTTPLLQDCPVKFDEPIPINLPPLRSIDLTGSTSTHDPSRLPVTLTKLSASISNTPEWLGAISKLTQLQDLQLNSVAALPSDGFWNLMKTRLTRLSSSSSSIESLQDLDGWQRLEFLNFYATNPVTINNTMDASSQQVSLRLTSTLTALDFTVPSAQLDVLNASFANLTQLKRLTLAITDNNDTNLAACSIPSLPSSLTHLCLYTFRLPDLLMYSELPRNLRSLRIEYLGSSCGSITEEHVKSMPKSLVAFDAYQMALIGSNWSLGTYLPNLSYSHFENINSRASLEVQRQEQVAQSLP